MSGQDSELFGIPENLVKVESITLVGISNETLIYWIKNYRTNSGKSLGRKIGGRWYIDKTALAEYLEEQE